MKSALIEEDDELMLETTVIEAGAALEALAEGNEKIPNKRKGGSICTQYNHKRRRIQSESFNSHVTLNHEAQVDDVMFSDCLANSVGSNAATDLVDKSAHGCHESVQNDYLNGSMREDGLCKLNENFCVLLTDNLMTFFDTGIEPNDDSHMHNGDSDDSSVLSFSSKSYINCVLNTEDTIDNIPDSQLLDSDEDVLEDSSFDGDLQDDYHCEDDSFDDDQQVVCYSDDDSFDDDQQDVCYSDDDSFDGEQEDVCHCEESISISHLNPARQEETICILNTEDPEIPCNNDIFIPIHSSPSARPQSDTESVDLESSFTQSQMDPNLSPEFGSANLHVDCTPESVSMDHDLSVSDHNDSDSDSDVFCHPDIEYAIPSPSVRPQTATDSIDSTSCFTQSQMEGSGLSSEFESACPHGGCTLKSVSVDHGPSTSDHNSDNDLPCFPETEDPEVPSPTIVPQNAMISIHPTSCFTQSQMEGPGLSSEFESASPHVGCTLKSVSVDHSPSTSGHNSDSDLPCFPETEDPEVPSPTVVPPNAMISIDPTSCFTQSQMDDPGLSSEFESASPPAGCIPKSLSVDYNPSTSDHSNDSYLPCFPDTGDPEIPSPSVRPLTDTDSIDPTSSNTQSQINGPDLSSEFESANPHVYCTLESVSKDHNPSSPSDHNSDSDLHGFLDIKNPELRSASIRLQTALDSIDLTSCFTEDDPDLSFDGYTPRSLSVDHNSAIPDHNSHSDLLCFPDIVDLEMPSTSVSPHSVDPASCFTQSQMDGPDLSWELDSAHPHVGRYLSVDHDPFITDHNNSDNDSDLPCFPDIDALILKLDFEYAQESWITNEVKRGTYKHYKPSVNRLEQRAMSSLGAFAVFCSHHFHYYIKKTEVTIGRSTDDTEVDVDLRKESHANMISRKQATIKMENDGTFTLKNIGRGLIFMNEKPIAHGQVAALSSGCLLQIKGMDFMFETNDGYVRWYLDNILKKTQGKFTAFEWSVN